MSEWIISEFHIWVTQKTAGLNSYNLITKNSNISEALNSIHKNIIKDLSYICFNFQNTFLKLTIPTKITSNPTPNPHELKSSISFPPSTLQILQ